MVRFPKLFIATAITSMCVCASASAQGETPVALAPDATRAVATNPFSQNWEVSLGIQGLSFFSNQEQNYDLPKSPFNGFRTSLGLAASVAKWFSPDIALRTKLSGFWGRSVISEDKSLNTVNYMNIQEDALVNLTNIIYDYKEDRLWNIIPYVGLGFARNFTHNRNTITMHLGLMPTYRINNRLKAFADLSYNIAGGEFDNMGVKANKIFTNRDCWIAMELGVTYELGQNRWKHMVDLDDVTVVPWDETQREMKRLYRSNKGLKDRINYMEIQKNENASPSVETKTVVKTPEISIFFEIGSHELNHRGQLENLKKIVEVAKEYQRYVIVTGYADSQTGNAQLNEKLSAQRADAIVKELLDMDIPMERIRIINGGGVNILNQVPANRRVVVSLGDSYAEK